MKRSLRLAAVRWRLFGSPEKPTDTNEKGKKGGNGKKGSKGSMGGKGGKGNKKDLSHITFHNCNAVGHFADKCTKEKVLKND